MAQKYLSTTLVQDNSIEEIQRADLDLLNKINNLNNTPIETDKLADGAITADKIEDGAITDIAIDDGSITTQKIADDAIVAAKIAELSIEAEKLAEGSVVAGKIDTNAVTANTILAGAVVAGKLAANSVIAGNLAADSVIAGNIYSETITADEIAANAVTTVKIDAQAVTTAKIDAGAITTDKILAETILAGNIAANAITTDKIDAEAVTANEILARTITSNSLATDAVDTRTILAGAVTTDKILAGTIVAGDINSTSVNTELITSRSSVSDAVISGNIDAATITVGKIQAEQIEVDTLFAENITISGTGDITAGDTVLDASGIVGPGFILTDTEHTIGGWIFNGTSQGSLRSDEIGSARIDMNPANNRIEVWGDGLIEPKTAMGYLLGLSDPTDRQNTITDPAAFGFWTGEGETLEVNGEMSLGNGQFVLKDDSSMDIKNSTTGYKRLRFGNDQGTEGLHAYNDATDALYGSMSITSLGVIENTSPYGASTFGNRNATLCFLTTESTYFYMDSGLKVDTGVISSYNEDLQLQRAGVTKLTLSNSVATHKTRVTSSSNIVSGLGSGGVALTINDGYGNANITFNHEGGKPEQVGNAARIEVNTDGTTNANMNFELLSGVTSDVATSLTTILNLRETTSNFYTDLKVNDNLEVTGSTILTKGLTIGTGAMTYQAGVLGFSDSWWGFIYRPPRIGTLAAHLFTAYDDTHILELYEDKTAKFLGDLTVEDSVTSPNFYGTASNATLLDNIDSTQFMRSDVTTVYDPPANQYMNFLMTPGQVPVGLTGNLSPLQIYQSTVGTDAFMTFHVGGDYATYFGLDGSTNDLFVGGWSMGATKNKIWHEGNMGSGSGLDADKLDNLDSTQFLRSDQADTMAGDLTITGNITVSGDINANGTQITGDGKKMLGYSDSWLRINDTKAFASGIYCGAGILRTDGELQVGSAGATFKANTSGAISSGTLNGASLGVTNASSSTGKGVSLYNGATSGQPTYGLMFAGGSTFGTHGYIGAGDWKTYFTMNSTTTTRGWIFKAGAGTAGNVASIRADGAAYFNSTVRGATVWGAVGNDYADAIEIDNDIDVEFGYVYIRDKNGTTRKSNKFMEDGVIGITTNTQSFTAHTYDKNEDKDRLPISVSGFVLAHVDREYESGTPLTCTAGGYLTRMKFLSRLLKPHLLLATYYKSMKKDEWNSVAVSGRHLVKVM